MTVSRTSAGPVAAKSDAVEAELFEEAQRVRGEPVAAGLVAREARLVEAYDAQPVLVTR